MQGVIFQHLNVLCTLTFFIFFTQIFEKIRNSNLILEKKIQYFKIAKISQNLRNSKVVLMI